jgi:hypothetical protein
MSATATKEETTTQQEPKAGRDARGRFTKGNKGGPGNPFAREVARLRATMVHAYTPKVFMRLMEVLRQKAEGGDMVAMKLVLQYVLGKPAETVDPDRIAIDEWQKLRDAAVNLDETSAVLEQVPATMACFLLKRFWPNASVQNVREMLEENAQAEAEADEDERYLAEQEKAEEEALRQSPGVREPGPTQAPSANGQNGKKASHRSLERRQRVSEPVTSLGRFYTSAGGNGDRPPSPYGALGDFLTESDLDKFATEGKRGSRRSRR